MAPVLDLHNVQYRPAIYVQEVHCQGRRIDNTRRMMVLEKIQTPPTSFVLSVADEYLLYFSYINIDIYRVPVTIFL